MKPEPKPDQRTIRELVNFDPAELHPYVKNPRRGNIDEIARSLETNGQYRPIVVNIGSKTGRPLEVLAGNHTLKAARKLGWTDITATTVDVDDLAAARIVAADNRTADLGDYDDDTLTALLQQIADSDLGLVGTGYDDTFLAELLTQDPTEPLDSGSTEQYAERFELVVECETEHQQATLFEKLSSEGWTCRLLTL